MRASMTYSHMDSSSQSPGKAIVAMAEELAEVAAALGASYLSAHIAMADGEDAVLTVENGKVTLTSRGSDVELRPGPSP